MPLYFFDSGDGDYFLRDDLGIELPGIQEARDEAVRLLPSIARDMRLDCDRRNIVAMVRNERDQLIFKATLSFKADWFVPHSEGQQRIGEP